MTPSYESALASKLKAEDRKKKRLAKRLELGGSVRAKKIPKANLRKRLIKALDKEFSLWIRERDQAQYGGSVLSGGPIQCVSHLLTRSKYSVRWEDLNGHGQTHAENFLHELDPSTYTLWFIKKYSLLAYEQLVRDGNKIKKWDVSDLESKLAEIASKRAALHSTEKERD